VFQALADLAPPECGQLAARGIEARIRRGERPYEIWAPPDGPAAAAPDAGCSQAGGCATPLLRPDSRSVGPVTVHGDG
jgi:hypothetical protein